MTGPEAPPPEIEALRRRIEELERARDEAIESAQMKSRFLANMSHELRTPMNGVMGMAMLLLDTPLLADQREYANAILRSAEALLVVVNDVLDFSKIEAGRLDIESAPFDLPLTLEQCLQTVGPVAAEKPLELHFDYAPSLPRWFVGDRIRIRQIVLNLLGNAVKFTESGWVRLRAAGGDGDITVDIEDTGIGIPPEWLPRLFEAFEQGDASMTRRFGGTGLGLSISRRLAELMGGRIEVQSEPGQGSRFTLQLPLTAVAGSFDGDPAIPVTGLEGPGESQLTLLIVDDNRVNLVVAAGLVKRLGFRVETAQSGAEAIEKALQRRFDGILLDCQMPEIDGFEVARRLRSHFTEGECPRIIAMTAMAMAGDRERCLSAGMDDYVAKPVRRQVIEETLRRWFGSCPSRAHTAGRTLPSGF